MNTLKLLNFIWGFILTKWYVNQDKWVFMQQADIAFYIN